METKKRPRVYITQVPHKRDRETNVFIPTVNIAPATEHGEIDVIMPPRASFYATGDLVRLLRDRLQHYDFEAGDSLVAMGDPTIIAVACAILGREFGAFRLLKWDRNVGRYMASVIRVY